MACHGAMRGAVQHILFVELPKSDNTQIDSYEDICGM